MADNADYMFMGYAVMAIILFGMVAWTYYRFKTLVREDALIDQFVAEEQAERGQQSAPVVSGTPATEDA